MKAKTYGKQMPKSEARPLGAPKKPKRIEGSEHDWEKSNLVTIAAKRGAMYDTYRCRTCKATSKRYGVHWPPEPDKKSEQWCTKSFTMDEKLAALPDAEPEVQAMLAEAIGEENLTETQKVVDSTSAAEVRSEQVEGNTANDAAATEAAGAKTMTLTLKNLSKNGKRAIYSGALQSINFTLGLFPDKTAPASIEIADGVFAVKAAPKPKLTKEERAALPKKTLAQKAADAQERANKLAAKAAAAASSL